MATEGQGGVLGKPRTPAVLLKDPGVLVKDPGVLLQNPGVLLKDPEVLQKDPRVPRDFRPYPTPRDPFRSQGPAPHIHSHEKASPADQF